MSAPWQRGTLPHKESSVPCSQRETPGAWLSAPTHQVFRHEVEVFCGEVRSGAEQALGSTASQAGDAARREPGPSTGRPLRRHLCVDRADSHAVSGVLSRAQVRSGDRVWTACRGQRNPGRASRTWGSCRPMGTCWCRCCKSRSGALCLGRELGRSASVSLDARGRRPTFCRAGYCGSTGGSAAGSFPRTFQKSGRQS